MEANALEEYNNLKSKSLILNLEVPFSINESASNNTKIVVTDVNSNTIRFSAKYRHIWLTDNALKAIKSMKEKGNVEIYVDDDCEVSVLSKESKELLCKLVASGAIRLERKGYINILFHLEQKLDIDIDAKNVELKVLARYIKVAMYLALYKNNKQIKFKLHNLYKRLNRLGVLNNRMDNKHPKLVNEYNHIKNDAIKLANELKG